ncbi:E3 ubiquitin/ISG15 ligase TRIM25-like [Hyperolius riggenbachi]|uniref:E3 ubiquitin/ISG15 ligase TRIM25-like n=1 Tax=Hyperolius riggenbachi TaxID=752182 RepID=UPI0035A33338
MASAGVTAELLCSICMEIYRDPVTLPCGHSFCRGCITRTWDLRDDLTEHKCPECQRNYSKRPELVRNTRLHNICQAFHATETDQEQTGVFCNYCDFPVPATKSCLQCETSLCDHHLRKHDRSGEHTLLPPTTDLGKRKCSVHKKILEYYCTEDATCVCVSCSVIGGHVGHKMMSLGEASEEKKKKLRNDLQTLMAETEEAEKRVQSLEERRRKAQEKAAGETERVTALFRDLRRRLEELERRVLSDITRRVQCYDDVIRRLEIKKEELSRKMRHIEELCHMTDPLTVLQESHTGDLCDTEDRHDEQLHDGGDLDVAGISHTLHTGLADIMSGVNVQKHTDTQATPPLSRPHPHPTPTAQHTQAYPHSSTEDKAPVTAKLSRPSPQPTPTAQHTQAYPHSSTEDKAPVTAKLSRPRPQPSSTAQHTQAYPHSSTEDKAPITAELSRPRPQPTPTAQHTQAYPHSSTEDKVPVTATLSRPRPHPSPTTQHTQRQAGGTHIGAAQQASGLPVYADILLDVATASNGLHISDDRKTASSSLWENRPDTAERFQYNIPQVLSSRSFSSGRHYWEVDVGRSDNCRVGMCYPSIARGGWQSLIGDNNKSWCLCKMGNKYAVIHDRKGIWLPDGIPSDRVRIYLDYEAGQISFYALCDPIRHLHTFTATFTEPLHAGLYVGWRGCIKISGGSQGV